jgi:DNA anti-recombination protein RmuC
MQANDATGAVMIDIDAELSYWRRLESQETSEFVFLFHESEPALRVGIHACLIYPD